MWRRILLILGYFGAALLVVGGTIILVAYGKGYSYDFKSGRFILNGLVIFKSDPAGAQIFVEGKNSRRKTPYRSTLEAGQYNFELNREGFVPWRKRLDVLASGVTNVPYAWLFPLKISSESLRAPGASGLIPNKSRRQFLYLAGNSVWMFDTASKQAKRVYTAKAATGEAPGEALESVSWSEDASHFIVRLRRENVPGYLVVEAGGDNSVIDVSQTFRSEFNDLRFNPANWRELYWNSPEGLRRLNIVDRTLSAPLVDRIVSYTFGGGRIYYVTSTKLGKALWALEGSGTKKEIIQSLAESDSYQLAYARYDDEDYLAVLPAQARTATLYSKVHTAQPLSRLLAKEVDQLSVSPEDNRFIAAYAPDRLYTYDLERSRTRHVDLGVEKISHLRWFDQFHLLLTTNSAVKVMEFDGGNPTAIKPSTAGLAAEVTASQDEIIYLSVPPAGQLPNLRWAKLR